MTDRISKKDDSAVQAWAEDLSDENLLCRDLGHNWKPLNATKIQGGYERTLRCSRCSASRSQVLDSSGTVLKGGYAYATGYLAKPGFGRLVKADRARVRLTSLLRTIKEG
jgi:hypothetical protein